LHKHAHASAQAVADVLETGAARFLQQSLEGTRHMGASTKLYAASQTLLSALRESWVFAALVEICSNLLACEQLAMIEIECETRTAHILGEEGLPPERRENLLQNARFLEPRITPGNAWIPQDGKQGNSILAPLGITALVPLWRDERSSGALVLLQLLPQRNGFDAEDRQVLELLSLYAGPCLRSQVHG